MLVSDPPKIILQKREEFPIFNVAAIKIDRTFHPPSRRSDGKIKSHFLFCPLCLCVCVTHLHPLVCHLVPTARYPSPLIGSRKRFSGGAVAGGGEKERSSVVPERTSEPSQAHNKQKIGGEGKRVFFFAINPPTNDAES